MRAFRIQTMLSVFLPVARIDLFNSEKYSLWTTYTSQKDKNRYSIYTTHLADLLTAMTIFSDMATTTQPYVFSAVFFARAAIPISGILSLTGFCTPAVRFVRFDCVMLNHQINIDFNSNDIN